MSLQQRAAARYQSVQVNTSSPARLVHMLLEGAIRFATDAIEAMEKKDRARAGERIGRCHAILEELAASLDREKAPELSDNLLGVYTFGMRRLLEANIAQNPSFVAEVRKTLEPLRDAWKELAAQPLK